MHQLLQVFRQFVDLGDRSAVEQDRYNGNASGERLADLDADEITRVRKSALTTFGVRRINPAVTDQRQQNVTLIDPTFQKNHEIHTGWDAVDVHEHMIARQHAREQTKN